MDFTLLPRAVFLGEIDTGVWHREPSLIPLEKIGLTIRPLDKPAALSMAESISSAVLVVRASSPVAQLLRQINFDEIKKQAVLPFNASETSLGRLTDILRFR